MIVAWSAHTGAEDRAGRAVVNYMMNDRVAKSDETGRRHRIVRDPPPEIIRGNPQLVRRAIERMHTKLVYSSCVLRFAQTDVDVAKFNARDPALREIVERLIGEFEEACFAGIPQECRPPTFWTTHTHTGRLELNFLCPRAIIAQKGIEERKGGKKQKDPNEREDTKEWEDAEDLEGTQERKGVVRPLIGQIAAYNPKPPNAQALFDAFRTAWNAEQGWADPDDPARVRAVKVPDHVLKTARTAEREGRGTPAKDVRVVVHDEIAYAVRNGQISSRGEMIAWLGARGYRLNRTGSDYISIVSAGEMQAGMPTLTRPIRLKGPLFSDAFDTLEAGQRIIGTPPTDQAPRVEPAEARRAFEEGLKKRAEFNRGRYGGPGWTDDPFYWSAMPKGPDPLDEMARRRHRRRQESGPAPKSERPPASRDTPAPFPVPTIEPLTPAETPGSRPARQRFRVRLWESLYRVDLPTDLSDQILYVDTKARSVRLADGAIVTDHGGRLTATETSRLAARLMAVEAQAKGWIGVKVGGDAEFLKLAAEECVRIGLPVMGRTPEMDEVIRQHLLDLGLERAEPPTVSMPLSRRAKPAPTHSPEPTPAGEERPPAGDEPDGPDGQDDPPREEGDERPLQKQSAPTNDPQSPEGDKTEPSPAAQGQPPAADEPDDPGREDVPPRKEDERPLQEQPDPTHDLQPPVGHETEPTPAAQEQPPAADQPDDPGGEDDPPREEDERPLQEQLDPTDDLQVPDENETEPDDPFEP